MDFIISDIADVILDGKTIFKTTSVSNEIDKPKKKYQVEITDADGNHFTHNTNTFDIDYENKTVTTDSFVLRNFSTKEEINE